MIGSSIEEELEDLDGIWLKHLLKREQEPWHCWILNKNRDNKLRPSCTRLVASPCNTTGLIFETRKRSQM